MGLATYILQQCGYDNHIDEKISAEEELLLAGQIAGDRWPTLTSEYKTLHPNLWAYSLSNAAFGRSIVDMVCDSNEHIRRFHGQVIRGVKPDAKLARKRIEIKGIRLRKNGEPCKTTDHWSNSNINHIRVDCAEYIIVGVIGLDNCEFYTVPAKKIKTLPGFSEQQTADCPECQVGFSKQSHSSWRQYAVQIDEIESVIQ